VAELTLTDLSPTPKWRVFDGYHLAPGTSKGTGEELVWSVTPGEWTVLGDQPDRETVELTHVRAMLRLTGDDAATLINRVCGLDLTDGMFPSGAAARTLFAGVATEIVRDDVDGTPSYLIVPSSSFKTYILEVIEDAGAELGLVTA
jgi:sarcosine oxidase gamma subunit